MFVTDGCGGGTYYPLCDRLTSNEIKREWNGKPGRWRTLRQGYRPTSVLIIRSVDMGNSTAAAYYARVCALKGSVMSCQ